MWEQLTPADFRRGHHVLNLRRAEILRRHAGEIKELQAKQAGEIKRLDAKYAQIDTLESLVESFLRERKEGGETIFCAYPHLAVTRAFPAHGVPGTAPVREPFIAISANPDSA